MDPFQFTTDALVRSAFRDHYELDAAKLESLYSKSKRHQWNAELDVDWKGFDPEADVLDRGTDFLSRLRCVQELPAAEQTALFRAASLFTVSQILHGEQAALMVCGQLVNAVPDLDGKFAAAVQVMDEARHVEVFARYLACQGLRHPLDPDLRAIVERLLAESDWESKCVGMQVILESVALGFFRMGERRAAEPLLRQFIPRVHEDEARHVAYGVATLERRIPELAPAARERLEDLAYDVVARIGGRAGKPAFRSQFQAMARAGIDLERFLPRLMAEVTGDEMPDLDGVPDALSDTVLPNLLRVGLLPEPLLAGYAAQGWFVDPGAGSVRDLHSFHPESRAVRRDLVSRGVDFSDPAQVRAAARPPDEVA